MRILCAVYSLSGNTEKTMKVAIEAFQQAGHSVVEYHIDPWHKEHQVPRINNFDLGVIGSYTEDFGSVPDEVKGFVKYNRGISTPVAVLGTGDNFWGEENYCGAVNRLAKFYNTPFETFKAEHYPSNRFQEVAIEEWAKKISDTMDKSNASNVLKTIKTFSPNIQIKSEDFVI